MEISVSGQTAAFLLSAVLGGGLCLFYDILRIFRGDRAGAIATALADILFCVAAAFSTIWYFMAVCGGEIRIYVFVGMVGGGVLYFLIFSPFIMRAGRAILELTFAVLKIVAAPFVRMFRFFCEILCFVKKVLKYFKKLFHFWREGYNIDNMGGAPGKRRKKLSGRDARVRRGGVRYEKDEKRSAD